MPDKLTIAIDYDETFTADTALWTDFITKAQFRGHRVVCVTARFETDSQRHELATALPPDVPIVFSYTVQKRAAAEAAGFKVNIWIDDYPEAICDPDPIQPCGMRMSQVGD